MLTHIIGWDIGGAHLKAAVINPERGVVGVYQQPCELWKGIGKLADAAQVILAQLPLLGCRRHILTMTGELADLFANRDDGVRCILNEMQALLPDAELWVYAGIKGLLKIKEVAPKHFPAIASANWLASASYVAQKLGNGLFVDIGSTTTDILLLQEGKVTAEGYSDYERLISQELVYTGIIRTPVMAISQIGRDDGKAVGLMAEYFATMADVYRVSGELNEYHDQTPTTDGAEKTVLASAKRLSRMIGCDFYENELPRWVSFAHDIKNRQLAHIQSACEHQLNRRCATSESYPLIGAGVGRFLVKQLAVQMARPYVDFSELFLLEFAESRLMPADCAPAVAVAYLAKTL